MIYTEHKFWYCGKGLLWFRLILRDLGTFVGLSMWVAQFAKAETFKKFMDGFEELLREATLICNHKNCYYWNKEFLNTDT